ncbi:hypothetical protein BKA57DRAFT_467966, partial [Linnemannia elongata]
MSTPTASPCIACLLFILFHIHSPQQQNTTQPPFVLLSLTRPLTHLSTPTLNPPSLFYPLDFSLLLFLLSFSLNY